VVSLQDVETPRRFASESGIIPVLVEDFLQCLCDLLGDQSKVSVEIPQLLDGLSYLRLVQTKLEAASDVLQPVGSTHFLLLG
jgi:hypothetical protein